MNLVSASAAALLLAASAAVSAGTPVASPPAAAQVRHAVRTGDTLYVSGQLDLDERGQPGKTPQESAKLALDHVKKVIEDAGFSMNDLVLVQVFSTDLKAFNDFNKVYRTYFSGPLPARAFIGAGSLLSGGRFEVLGIAVKAKK